MLCCGCIVVVYRQVTPASFASPNTSDKARLFEAIFPRIDSADDTRHFEKCDEPVGLFEIGAVDTETEAFATY